MLSLLADLNCQIRDLDRLAAAACAFAFLTALPQCLWQYHSEADHDVTVRHSSVSVCLSKQQQLT